MPSTVIFPGNDATAAIKDVKTQDAIANFSTLLLFFEEFMFLAEKRLPAMIQFGSPHRPLNSGPEIDFLRNNNLCFVALCPPDRPVWQATKIAQDDFASGRVFLDEDCTVIDTSATMNRDVFVSRRASEHYPERTHCLNIEFVDGLTVPAPDIPWEDILEFRERRRGEYQQFWWTLFDSANRIDWLSSNNPERELQDRVFRQLEEFERASSKTWLRKVRDSVSIQIVLDGSAKAAIGGSALSSLVLPDPVAIALGALGAVRFSVELAHARTPMPQGASGMSFLSRVRSANYV